MLNYARLKKFITITQFEDLKPLLEKVKVEKETSKKTKNSENYISMSDYVCV